MTYIILAITVLVSIAAFNNESNMHKLNLNPYQVYQRKEWYRLLSHGFVHADWNHLLLNMLVLFFFGPAIENIFTDLAGRGMLRFPKMYYMALYLGGIIIASLSSVRKNKDNPWYNAVGASGAVSAVVFTFIFFAPWSKLLIFFIIPMPGIVFGILYMAYSYYMSKKNVDHINHEAHYYGAVFGFFFPLIIDYRLIYVFLDQINPF